jgi:hypothetical protein
MGKFQGLMIAVGPRGAYVVTLSSPGTKIDGLGHVGVRVAPGLARLQTDPSSELVAPGDEQIRCPLEYLCTLLGRNRAPLAEPGARGRHGDGRLLRRRGAARSKDS